MTGIRARKRRQKLAQILAAAEQILVEEGLEALTVHRLAKALSWTPGAMYRYFESKDAVLVALVVQGLEVVREVFGEAWRLAAPVAEGFTAQQRALWPLVVATHVYSALPVLMPNRYRLIAVSVGDPRPFIPEPGVRPVVEATGALLGEIALHLEEAVRQGALRPDEDRAARTLALWACVHGAVSMQKFARLGATPLWQAQLLQSVVGGLLRDWGAAPEDVQHVFSHLGQLDAQGSLAQEALGAWRLRQEEVQP